MPTFDGDTIGGIVENAWNNYHGNEKPEQGEVFFPDDGCGDHIDTIINKAFQEVLDWHNEQVRAGSCPDCGLHHTESNPCMGGNLPLTEGELYYSLTGWSVAQAVDTAHIKSHGPGYVYMFQQWQPIEAITVREVKKEDSKLSCGAGVAIVLLVIALVLYMMVTS
jgi:hypothetical protein